MTQNQKNAPADGNPGGAFKALYDIVARLRGPGGCPWDMEQTASSLRGELINETYECIEAIDEKNPAHIREELGDMFLLATMLSYIHEQEGKFTIADVLQEVSEKLIRRHPHVFAGLEVKDSSEVLDNWAKIKVEKEGRKPKDSILDNVGSGLPPLDRAYKLQKKAEKAGFDWSDIDGVIKKVNEEFGETIEAVTKGINEKNSGSQEKIEEELGDLLFSVVNLCRYLNVEPSVALNRTNGKFIDRFKYVEKMMKENGREMNRDNLDIMDRFWNDAKKIPIGERGIWSSGR